MLIGRSHVIVSIAIGPTPFHVVALDPEKLVEGVAWVSCALLQLRPIRNSKCSCHRTVTVENKTTHNSICYGGTLYRAMVALSSSIGLWWHSLYGNGGTLYRAIYRAMVAGYGGTLSIGLWWHSLSTIAL